jgi:hypothetical protein
MPHQTASSLPFLALASMLVVENPARAQIAEWTFETSAPSGLHSGWFTNIASEIGGGTASAFHTGTALYSIVPSGNGSSRFFGSTNWLVGDFFQFSASTVGSFGIKLSWDQTSSAIGPVKFNLQYSTDGSSFTTFITDYGVATNGAATINGGSGGPTSGAWSSTTPATGYSYSYDLSSITDLNNQSTVYFRLVDDSSVTASGGTVNSAGTDRVDNFTIAVVPEPEAVTLLLSFGILASVFRRRPSALSKA